MRSHPARYLLLLTLLAAAVAGGWYATRPDPVAVRLAAIGPGLVERIVANTRAGTVKACRRARLAPGVGGQITTLAIGEGQRVEKGALLLELWNDDLVARVTLAEREAESAHSKTRAACLKAAHASREAVRLRKLRERGMTSEGTVDEADTQANALQADCEAARAAALVREARIGVARANLAKTRLTAPFPGVVAEVNGELHEYVTPSPPGIPTPPAVDLIDDSCFYVTAPIDEVDAPEVAVDQPARITLDAFGERRFQARVRRVAPYVLDLEKQARTVEVEVEFSDGAGQGELLAGYSADVEIVTGRRDSVLRIPTEALMEGDRVYLYDTAAGVLREREIETGISNWDWTVVRGGLRTGERVVVSLAREGLADGVTAVPEQETAEQ